MNTSLCLHAITPPRHLMSIDTLQASLWTVSSATYPPFEPSYTISTHSCFQTVRLESFQELACHSIPVIELVLVSFGWRWNYQTTLRLLRPARGIAGNDEDHTASSLPCPSQYIDQTNLGQKITEKIITVNVYEMSPYREEPRSVAFRMVIRLCPRPEPSFLWPLASVLSHLAFYARQKNKGDQSTWKFDATLMPSLAVFCICFASESHFFCILMIL